MIVSTSTEIPYVTLFSDGRHEAKSDTTLENGGGGAGFRPHDMLEAALACCLNMSIRIYAEKREIPLTGARVKVTLHRDDPGRTVFKYQVELDGDLTAAQRTELMDLATACPVGRTLSAEISICRDESKAPLSAPHKGGFFQSA